MHPSAVDYQDLHFWPWACLTDAQALLSAQNGLLVHDATLTQRLQATNHMRLSAYHFIMTASSLAKFLKKSAHLFAPLKVPYEAAQHLRSEAYYLRKMVEHSDISLRAKGPRGGFVRRTTLLNDLLPGDKDGEIDAVSYVTTAEGMWLGGRLLVERVIAETTAIYEATKAIPRWLPADPPSAK